MRFERLHALLLACAIATPIEAQTPDLEICDDVVLSIVGRDHDGGVFDGTYWTNTPHDLVVDVPDDLTIGDVQVYVDWNSEVYEIKPNLSLTSPAGTSVEIAWNGLAASDGPSPHISGGGNYFVACVFSDLGTWGKQSVWYDGTPIRGREPLSAFEGESAAGEWTLTAKTGSNLNVGILNRWCLRLFEELRPLAVSDLACTVTGQDVEVTWTNAEDYDGASLYLNGELEREWDGTFPEGSGFSYTLKKVPAPQYAEILIVPLVDGVGDGHPARCRAAVLAEPVAESCAYPDVMFSLAEPVSTSMRIGEDLTVTDLHVGVEITGSVGLRFIELSLESPAGTSVFLMKRCSPFQSPPPCGAQGWNGVAGTSAQDVTATFWDLGRMNHPYFDGAEHIMPSGPGYLSDFVGESAAGDWTLRAEDRGFNPDFESTIAAWCLRFYEEPPAFPIRDLTCTPGAESGRFDLSWRNGAAYDEIQVLLDDEPIETLPGPFTSGEEGSWSYELPPYPSYGVLCLRGWIGGAPGKKVCCRARTEAIANLACTARTDGTGEVDLEWDSYIEFDEVRVYVNEVLDATLGGSASSHSTVAREVPASLEIRVEGEIPGRTVALECRVAVLAVARVELCDAARLPIVPGAAATLEAEVSDRFAVGGVEVPLEFSGEGTWGLSILLTSPDGTVVVLYWAELGDRTPNLVISSAGVPSASTEGGCRCLVQPRGPGDLADFYGEPSAGTWRLGLRNDYTYAVELTLDSWCLRLFDGCELELPTELTCEADGDDVVLSWTNGADYDDIQVLRGTIPIASLAGGETTYRDATPPLGRLEYRVSALAGGCRALSATCVLEHGLTEVCESGLGQDATDVSNVLLFPGGITAGQVELGVVLSNDVDGVFHRIELESPAGTRVAVMDRWLNRAFDFDVVFGDRGLPFYRMLLPEGLLLEPPLPGTLEAFRGETLFEDFWTVEVGVGGGNAVLDELCLRVYEEDCSLPPPVGLECSISGHELTLSWENGETYEEVEVLLNGVLAAARPGSETSFQREPLLPGPYRIEVLGRDDNDCRSSAVACEVEVGAREICSEPSLEVPGGGTLSDGIEVGDGPPPVGLEVDIELPASTTASWCLTITSPDGTALVLHDHRGGAGGFDATFSDRGRPNTGLYVPDFDCGCRIRPHGPGSLQDLTASRADGTWTLEVANDVGSPAAVLVRWCIRLFDSCDGEAPFGLACEGEADGASLTWSTGEDYESTIVYRDGVPIAVLDGDAVEYIDTGVSPGVREFRVAGVVWSCPAASESCSVEVGRRHRCSEPLEFEDGFEHTLELEFAQEFQIDSVEVSLAGIASGTSPEIGLESPWGTRVQLADQVVAQTSTGDLFLNYGFVPDSAIDVTFADRGRPFEHWYLGTGDVLAPVGPGKHADFSGELSSGPQPWTLTVEDLASLESWCIELYPRGGQTIETEFRRGDVDGSGGVSALLDALYLLSYGFLSGPAPPCLQAADADDSGGVAPLIDALYLLTWAFLSGPAPPAPGPVCGVDGTADALDCRVSACEQE